MNPHPVTPDQLAVHLEAMKTFHREKVRHSSARSRKQKLAAIKRWLIDHQDDLTEAIQGDIGIPRTEGLLLNILSTVQAINHTRRHLGSWMKPQSASTPLVQFGASGWVVQEPRGVCLIISPWNFPVLLLIEPLVSAIAAGNCCILKPSELAPRTSELLANMAVHLFDTREVTVIQGGADVSRQLVSLPVDHIFFTGGTTVGSSILETAARRLTPVTLELGGMNPALVDRSANLKETAQRLAWGKWVNNGQACVSINTVYAEESVVPVLINELTETLKQFYPGSPATNPDYGRVVTANHTARILSLIQESVARGAHLVTGGNGSEHDRFIEPTILTDVPLDAPVIRQEIFGPVLAIVPVKSWKQIYDHLYHQPVPLSLYLFSREAAMIRQHMSHTRSGTVGLNETVIHFSNNGLPFGGINESGFGKAHGKWGFLAFSNERAVFRQRSGLTTIRLFYPPYRPWQEWLLKKIIRWL